MSIRMRHTKGHRNNRRQHLKLSAVSMVACLKCKVPVLPHRLCENCGTYRGREVVDVLAALTKKERKQKEKELKEQEAAAPEQELDPTALSKK